MRASSSWTKIELDERLDRFCSEDRCIFISCKAKQTINKLDCPIKIFLEGL